VVYVLLDRLRRKKRGPAVRVVEPRLAPGGIA